MRITLCCLLFTGVLLPLLLPAQDDTLRLRVRYRNIPLEKVLQSLEDRTGVHFSYSPKAIGAERRVTIRTSEVTLRELLDQLLIPLQISYQFLEQQIVLRPFTAEDSIHPSVVPAGISHPPAVHTVSGFVRDKRSGEALVGANIFARGTPSGCISNAYGFYSLTLPSGAYVLVYSFLGYREHQVALQLNSGQVISPLLEEKPLEITGVEIRSDRLTSIPVPEPGGFTLTPSALRQLPAFAGNPDLLKALQVIPGIRAYGDGSSLYYVRGGNHDQNLLMLDEAPIYNPSHLFGFFSALSPEAVNDAEVYKGDFPARYGGRLSSVIDVTAREGSMKRFGFSGNAGPFASYATLEGPILKDRSSFFLSGRIATLNWLNYLNRDYSGYGLFFFDINGKINLNLGPRDRLFLTIYGGQDEFSRETAAVYRTFGARWDNLAASLRWNHLFSNRLFSNTTLCFSRYRYFLYISEEKDFWFSSIGNLTFKSDLTWYLNTRNTLRGGLEVTGHHTDPGNVTIVSGVSSEQAPEVSTYNTINYTLYLSNEQILPWKLRLDYGIRLTLWQDVGPATLYAFDVNHRVIDTTQYRSLNVYDWFLLPEPRLTIRCIPSQNISFHAGYARTIQLMQTLSNSTGPFTSLEVWVPAGPNIDPQQADQYTLGVAGKIPGAGLTLSAEGYYKRFHNHIDYRDHANMLYNPLIEGEVRQGTADAWGLELLVRRSAGRVTGWAGYTWSRSMVTTPGINGGVRYPASFDSPHNFILNVAWESRNRWSLSATWIYLTGNPVTTPTGFYYLNGYTVPIYGSRNNTRLPDYHRLDLAITCRFNKPGDRFRHQLMFTLYNAYGRLNPFSFNFNRTEGSDGKLVIPSNTYVTSELIPTTLSVAGIVPSINYLFRF